MLTQLTHFTKALPNTSTLAISKHKTKKGINYKLFKKFLFCWGGVAGLPGSQPQGAGPVSDALQVFSPPRVVDPDQAFQVYPDPIWIQCFDEQNLKNKKI